MKITEVRIFSTESRDGKLKAFATMTFDDWFVVRNVKVIQGSNGLFVAMPSRKAVSSCSKCQFKNAIGSKYCNHCGAPIKETYNTREAGHHDSQAEHMDIAHPITQECRVYIQDMILEAYNKEQGGQAKVQEKDVPKESKEQEKTEDVPAPEPEKKEEAKEEVKEEAKEETKEEVKEEVKEEAEEKPSSIEAPNMDSIQDIEL
ncbi:MAG: septation protein SpoVG family protein [Candidatus Omnitrophica bacterium]|nr:septation protein SpoVG family protein [Candidatus Omnitrophota bacterium]